MKAPEIALLTAGLLVYAMLPAQNQQPFSPGYVIDLKGDTIKGEIKIPRSGKEYELFGKVSIKISAYEQKNFKAAKVKEYNLDGYSYIPKKVDSEMVFMKRVSTGALNLYEYKFLDFLMGKEEVKTEYYIEKNGEDDLVRLKSGKFKKQVSEIISDNEELVKEIEENYEYNNIADLVNEYNSWAKQQKG
jgi:hypothetical protein